MHESLRSHRPHTLAQCNVESLEIRHLRYFVAVIEKRGFRCASLFTAVSQPSLSRQVRQLEDTLGVKLLLRMPRGVQPTPAGQVFYEDARSILALLDQASSRTRETVRTRDYG